jgi:hypothetical protein
MIGESDPTPGFFFYGDQFPSIPDQIAILRGNQSASGEEPGDIRYIQSVRTIGLSPGAETDLWVAVIAAENEAAFADAADAAGDAGGRCRGAGVVVCSARHRHGPGVEEADVWQGLLAQAHGQAIPRWGGVTAVGRTSARAPVA